MYGWGGGGSRARRPRGTADADNPSEATIERRREDDIAFLAWVRTASEADIEAAWPHAAPWRRIAMDRRLAKIRAASEGSSDF